MDVCFFLDGVVAEFCEIIKQKAYGRLEHIHHELMLLLDKQWFEFTSANLEQPSQVTVLVLVFVEQRKFVDAPFHNLGDVAG
jgi:hypothetical protein